ncbi:MAG: D-alanyl-D-alanine carboxypeptidase [Holophaga sp.]|nr:D-alanyl-D-alanine carboxypeptidase [Holophaga sp.]
MLRSLLALFMLVALPARTEDLQHWAHRMELRSVRDSVGLWDLETGKMLEGHQMDLALVPASTTKVISTYAILKTLKPDYELSTEVWGDLHAGTVSGDLIFKGGGDPVLTSERIYLLAHELKGRGVLRVTGRIRLDQSAFDSQRYGNGWERTSSNTTPPILPLSVNFNKESGRLVGDPERYAEDTLQRILTEAGIAIQGGAQAGSTPQRILSFPSLPLRDLVSQANKFSNNFMVEMLVKQFGAGSWPQGVARIQGFYASLLGLGADKIAITDGSGLSKENHLSARTLAIVLRAARNDFEVGPEMVSSMKIIGGEPWKLHIKDPNLARRIRCKTGHLNGVTSVCGYLQTLDGKLRVFAILLNGPCDEGDAWELVSRWAN